MTDSTPVYFHNYDKSGVNKCVDEIDEENHMVEILDPSSDCKTALVKKLKD